MPELPEVETVRRGLLPVLVGRRIADVVQRRADLRAPMPERFATRLTGRRVEDIGRRGKYLLFYLDSAEVWIAHLGMSGRFCIDRSDVLPPGPHDHLILRTDDGGRIRFNDPRRFGFMDLTPAAGLDRHPQLATLGPDPLAPAFDAAWLDAKLAGRSMPIKPAILDQRIVAGMGNIYASESLFHAGISPERCAASVVGSCARRLADAIKSVLTDAIAAGGSSLRDYVRPSGELGFFQFQFAVYGRAGEPCPGCLCEQSQGGGIRKIVQSGRSTFYCGRRQH
ncbi:MAG: bifunctional DNA-formamidopyrimidine glycosylase/DNA-(apurinic or apyrimidinic site) lyase [Rhodospirillales bacterium]|nr:bifunctional DNA-formamidopyrimidine glycosylase/DNA-(apurinic or apyrimidinic site) lyase [Rhodospirillales bacterium]